MIVLRFAPSPTGHLHLGGARTALFNWLVARRAGRGGRFLVRIEDTDRARSRPEFARSILEALRWLGLEWDGEPVRQSDRAEGHRRALERLEASRQAYRCFCPPAQLEKAREMARAAGRRYRYPGTCRGLERPPAGASSSVLRFRSPELEASPVMDRIVGRIGVGGEEADDFVLTRSDGTPLYNLCCVVDDAEMGVTHVVRGADHIDNTRRQALLYDALGLERPVFAHLPLVSGLSKRHGATSVLSYRDQGFLPEAVVNYIARLGWSRRDQELFTLEELVEVFRLADVGHSASRVNPDKLRWLNEKHLRRASTGRLLTLLEQDELVGGEIDRERWQQAIELYKERCRSLTELAESTRPLLSGVDEAELDRGQVERLLDGEMRDYLVELANLVGRIEHYERAEVKAAMWEQLAARGLGFRQVAPACRLALVGVAAGPRLLDVMMVLEREQVIDRLRWASQW